MKADWYKLCNRK